MKPETLPIVRPDALNLRGRSRPLSRSLELQVIALCARAAPYRIEALPLWSGAPDSLGSLIEATQGTVRPESETGAGSIRADRFGALLGERIPVWAGASDRTIWSGPSVNYLFRAWHDATHVAACAEFDTAGELRVARIQCAQIEGKPERAILWAETAGQVLYHNAHGAFPTDQRLFVAHAIAHGLERTIARGVYHNAA